MAQATPEEGPEPRTGRILVWHTKHGDRYYDASTPEIWAASCLEILRQMDEEMGFFYEEDEDDDDFVAMTDEEIAALPPSYRPDATRRRALNTELQRSARRHNKRVADVRHVLDTQDTGLVTRGRPGRQRQEPKAWSLFYTGYDAPEYERVSLETVWHPTATGA